MLFYSLSILRSLVKIYPIKCVYLFLYSFKAQYSRSRQQECLESNSLCRILVLRTSQRLPLMWETNASLVLKLTDPRDKTVAYHGPPASGVLLLPSPSPGSQKYHIVSTRVLHNKYFLRAALCIKWEISPRQKNPPNFKNNQFGTHQLNLSLTRSLVQGHSTHVVWWKWSWYSKG